MSPNNENDLPSFKHNRAGPITLAELARRFGGVLRGNPETEIDHVAPLHRAGPRAIAFVAGQRYLDELSRTSAGVVILSPRDAGGYAGNALVVDNPHACFAKVAQLLHPPHTQPAGMAPTAQIASGARVAASATVAAFASIEAGAAIGEHVVVGPGCHIGRNVEIGEDTRLLANVVVAHDCRLGRRCLVQAGAVIGTDGFGFARDGERWQKVPQLGRVVIGDDVEIGANTTIDRGALDDTIIGNGVKLDNQVHIAHNVRIGDHTAIAACVGIAGSTTIGARCTFGGHIGIIDHLVITDDVHVTAGSLVTSSITHAGIYSSSLKAQPVEEWRRNAARLHHLDELAHRVRDLEAMLKKFTQEHKP